MIYFDHNATTPMDERVVETMLPYLNTFYGNPSSLYRAGRIARSAIDTAREQVATLVNAHPSQIIFTSGGTEANNLALKIAKPNVRIAVSAIEHPSIIEPARRNKQQDDFIVIPVEANSLISLSSVELLYQDTKAVEFISIMLANNENGSIQNIQGISHFLKDKKVIIHTDAVQAIGKTPVSFSQLGVDLMTLSSHKIYGPKGCGALVIKKGIDIEPLLMGGGQENALRAGTENVASIVGFGKASELAFLEMEQRTEHCLFLREKLEQELNELPGLIIFSKGAKRLSNTVQFGIQGTDGEMLQMQLDQKNIAVSTGSACNSGRKASSVLTAMGIDYQLAKSAIRVSLGKANTEEEINEFIKVLKSFLKTSEKNVNYIN